MLKHPVNLVIFDKDGLIMDTEAPVHLVWARVFKRWGLKELTLKTYAKFIGFDRKKNISQVEELFPGVDAEALLNECGVEVREHLLNNPIGTMPGLFELLDFLDEKGIKKAIATSSRYENAKLTLEKCGIFHRFDTIISGDMVARSKPAPDIFLKACEVLKVPVDESLVLEDSNAGVQAAYAAGIPVIVIPDLVEPSIETLSLCEQRCKNLSEVIHILQNL